jgi:hypothetical protein
VDHPGAAAVLSDGARPADVGSVSVSARRWLAWVAVTFATLPASACLWFIGAMSAGGGEIYDPPPPFFVDLGIPGGWEAIACAPTVVGGVVGYVALRRRSRGLVVTALMAAFVVAAVGIFAILAID